MKHKLCQCLKCGSELEYNEAELEKNSHFLKEEFICQDALVVRK